MTNVYIFSPNFNKVYHVAGDHFTSVVVEANTEEEARQLLKDHPDYWDDDTAEWQVQTAEQLKTGQPHVILLTYGMY